jgi:PAS domain S-box-containing protein
MNDLGAKSKEMDGIFAGGGELGALMRAHDWSTSPIGFPDTWPQALRSAVSMMLPSKHVMFVAWGPELAFLYNDAYRPVFGKKHPGALGRPFREIWSEVWDDVAPLVDTALRGEATWSENLPLVLERNGYREDCWFTFSYSPVRDESGKVAGLFCAAAETTERVLGERRLVAERERQRRLFEQVPGFVAILRGPDHIFEYVNDAYDRVAGKRGFVGQTVRAAFPDLEGSGLFEALDRAFTTGEPYVARDVPLNLQRTAGAEPDPLILSFTYQPIIDENGEVTGIFIQGQDVTQEHQALAAVRAERDRQLMLMQQMPGFVAVLAGPNHIYDYVNDAYVHMVGPRDFIGRSVREVFPELEGQGFFETLDSVHATGEPILVKAVPIRFTGEARDRFIDLLYQPIRNAAGEVTGIFAGGYDITERIRAEKARDAIEARVDTLNEDIERSIVERADDRSLVWRISPDLLGVLRADGHFETTNPAWKTTLGWSESEIISMSIFEMLHPEDVERTRGGFEAILAGNTVVNFENRYRCKVGGYRTLSWVGVPERDKIYCIGRDITAERAAAEKLSFTEAALRQSQKMEAMGQLTGGVAHDFNNLLTPIIGSLDMLMRRGLGNDRERRLIEGALQSADRAKMLVQRLLAFARLQPLQAVAVDLGTLVDGMAKLISSTVGPNVVVRVEVDDNLPPASADANQLEMAILNLGVNARDAMPNGGTLTITAAHESVHGDHRSGLKQGHYLRLSVTDSGNGMDAATLARAIEPFFSTKGIGKGTGLGLSMVHGLAAQLGGGLTIVSELGRGTAAELWLPVSLAPLGHEDETRAAPTPITSRRCALLVDDEEIVRMSTADMLADLGYDVIEANSAEQALRLLDEGAAPDLLITDYLMPGMSGAKLVEEVRARKPGLPILIVSGYAEPDGIAPDLPRLTKPFQSAELAQSLASLAR